MLIVLQTVKALHYLKEEHGVIHRGTATACVSVLMSWLYRSLSVVVMCSYIWCVHTMCMSCISSHRHQTIEHSTRRPGPHQVVRFRHQRPSRRLKGANSWCWLCRLPGRECHVTSRRCLGRYIKCEQLCTLVLRYCLH